MDLSFYKNKKVLITGHTGFKGSWMCKVLLMAGAEVTGYALMPPTEPSLFEVMGLLGEDKISMDQGTLRTVIGDVRDLASLQKVFDQAQPEIVIHMAAQPIVRESYRDPVGTYETNVMGTVNVLECVRRQRSVKSFVNVTTDKVYLNREWDWGYRENEELNGYDPYSNSKSCSELVTSSYRNSFFGGDTNQREDGSKIAITTMRAGNVIGGGDFAKDRIIPDCIRSVEAKEPIVVRNPYSTRPYQHVLEPVMAYLMVAAAQFEHPELSGNYNVGPDDVDCYQTGNLVDLFCKCWNQQKNSGPSANNNLSENSASSINGNPSENRDPSKHINLPKDSGFCASWKNVAEEGAPHEANFLKLDCAKLKKTFGWKPVWNLDRAMEKIVEWSSIYLDAPEDQAEKLLKCMEGQILEYLEGMVSAAGAQAL